MDSEIPGKPVATSSTPTWKTFKFPLRITALALIGAIIAVFIAGEHRQGGVMKMMGIFLVWSVVNLVWLIFFSKLIAKWKLVLLAVVILPLLITKSLFTINGVSGDLVPIIEWKGDSVELEAPIIMTEGLEENSDEVNEGAGDFRQFLGNDRNIRVSDVKLASDWEAVPPKELWRRDVGEGWSGFAVAGRFAITMEQRKEDEMIIAYHLLTGVPLWEYHYVAKYDNPVGGVGPRTTVAVDDNVVFCLGSTGMLTALNLENGERIWQVSLMDLMGAPLPEWGFASSPLIHDGNVIVSSGAPNGNSLTAFNRETGEKAWSGGSEKAAWSTPMLAEVAGKQVILMVTHKKVTAHDPESGKPVWTYPWDNKNMPNVSVPLVFEDDQVLLSSGYGKGAELIKISADGEGVFSANRVWKSLSMKAKFSNMALIDRHVFGLDDGIFACVNVETGRRVWKDGRYGHGQILLVDDLFLISCENGSVVLVEGDITESKELTRFEAFDHKMWNPPALAGKYLLVRTHKQAACYELPVK
ncbi:PQQ-like beta-propeller repeat protein [Verrucomicrobia bacterium]|nr:PQQ-like beta-propeller repeat protein [Verrucomicrobiota bacterium]MDB4458943.1 PQQ-like beta-propeller repeat protein [bacterium]